MTREGKFYVSEAEQNRFLQDIKIEKSVLKKIKSKAKKEREGFEKVGKATGIVTMANSIFGALSFELSKEGFKGLHYSLRKANMPFLLSAYLSLMFFFTFIAFFVGLGIAMLVSLTSNASSLIFLRNILISLLLPLVTFISFLAYPGSRISGAKQDIENELPFAAVHMSAIASSGIEPSKIFQIIAMSKEYRLIAREARKILNQMNLYGYDLTTALRNVSSMTSNKKFAELLNGISSTITSGGNLADYLNEKAKSLLIDYRLSREKYASTIGMYADIYTALLIAAPLIFMLILVIIGSLGASIIGMDASSLATAGIIIIAILNVIFLVFLQLTQPKM